jgi:carbon-monoxide dehydrogenase medium subunit
MPLGALFAGPHKTSLAVDELLVAVVIPKHNFGKPTAFQKFGLRKGQALALVNAAASLWIDRDGTTARAPRIALGAVAPTVIRAAQAEAYLDGRAITYEAMAEAGRIAADEAKPISDFRASADYRRHLVAVLVKRALASAYVWSCAQHKEQIP